MSFKIYPLISINFHGYGFALYQNRPNVHPPSNYIEDFFKIFVNSGITCVRVTFYWESWELNRDQCLIDLKDIADAGDKYGIMCIHDNHQWECSSWIGIGIGIGYQTRLCLDIIQDKCGKEILLSKNNVK